jgi:subtilase family serine protease
MNCNLKAPLRLISLPHHLRATRRTLPALLVAMLGVAAFAQIQKVRPVYPVRSEFAVSARSLVSSAIDRARVTETSGAVSPLSRMATDLGPMAAGASIRNMQLVLNRPAERQKAYDSLLEALHTPGNPSFHKWLVPAQVGEEFGPSDADIATLTGFLESEGFTVANVGSGHTFVDFSGTAAQVEKTFHTKMHRFQLANGSVHYSATREALIPEALAPLVVGFAGLSDIPAARTMIRKPVTPAPQTPRKSGDYVYTKSGPGTPLDTVSSTNYAVGPQDFYTIYNENSLLSASQPITGSGVTIALLEEVRITPADVTAFRTNFQVVPNTPVSLVVDNGYTGGNATAQSCTDPGANTTSDQLDEEGEAILDTEWAGSVAPDANLLYVTCTAGALPLGTVIAAEVVIDNNLADIMSMSYGLYEGYSPAEDTLVNQLWEQAASQGQAVVISSGDSGSAIEDGNYGDTSAKYGITVNGIASTPWNVSAGGTDFMDEFDTLESDTAYGLAQYWNTTTSTAANGFSSAKSYIPEMTWSDSCASSVYSRYYYSGVSQANPATFCGANTATKNVTAGGGGPSRLYARPSWQTGTVYGLPSTSTQPNRLQPDISLFASNGFWYHTLPSYQSDNGGYSYAGGTSFVAPQLAGVFALVEQATGERLGQPDYVLYAMAGKAFGTSTSTGACGSSGSTYDAPAAATPLASCIFYDVQVGTNSVPCRTGSTNCSVVSGKTYGILADPTATATNPTPAYSTGVGYDMGTGIGTLNIANLVNHWQNSTDGQTYTASVAVTPAANPVAYGSSAGVTLTATVSGPASFPTGSIAFAGPGTTSLGSVALTPSADCATNGACTETALLTVNTATYKPGTYTFTALYSPTNENYVAGANGTASITVGLAPVTVYGANFTVAQGATVALNFITMNVLGTPPTGAITVQVNGSSTGLGMLTCVNKTTHSNCQINYSAPASITPGTYTVTFQEAADTSYQAASGSGMVTVTQSVSANAVPSQSLKRRATSLVAPGRFVQGR